ncbi:MAG TPA: DinB family protein [Trueperaceae bacterium]
MLTPDIDFDLDDATAVLERTPASLIALLGGLPDRWTAATEGDGTWSPYDVLGHLVHGERVNWMPRLRHILEGRSEPFEEFDRTAQFRDSAGRSLSELLVTFAELRRENLAELRLLGLTDADLQRRGLHPNLGEVRLAELLATWAVHDLDHVTQISRTMAKVYRAAVGPWSAFLSILRDRE